MLASRLLKRRVAAAAFLRMPCGLKPVNQLVKSSLLQCHPKQAIGITDPGELRLANDGLKDAFTWLGTPLRDSPHHKLMLALEAGGTVRGSEYALAQARGTLDFRRASPVSLAQCERMRARYRTLRTRIVAGNVPEVYVIRLNETLYILDGKHTASTALALRSPVLALDASPFARDSYFYWMYRVMSQTPSDFATHLEYFGNIFSNIGTVDAP
jgi:hypothetical protein